MIGLTPKQLAYSLELPVGEPERAVDRLFFDLRQRIVSLSVRLDVPAVEALSFAGALLYSPARGVDAK